MVSTCTPDHDSAQGLIFGFWVSLPFASLLGELTDLGRLSTLRVGRELRKLYVDK